MSALQQSQLDVLFDGLREVAPPSLDIRIRQSKDDDPWGSLEIGNTKYTIHYFNQLTDAGISLLLASRGTTPPPFVVTERIKQDDAERLRKENIPFLDARGNAFISVPGVFLYILGQNRVGQFQKPKSREGKLFKYSGIKLIYTLLTDPSLDAKPVTAVINGTVREIASKADISLGSVSDLLSEMAVRGYLAEEGDGPRKKRLLLNRTELIQKWVHGYCEYRPRKNVVHLLSSKPDWWKDTRIGDYGAKWGGEVAATLLTDGFLVNPQVATVYAEETMYSLVLDASLQQVESDGNVEIMAPLPSVRSDTPDPCVHPLLVYADLLYSGDDRNREAAERIYDRYLHSLVHPA